MEDEPVVAPVSASGTLERGVALGASRPVKTRTPAPPSEAAAAAERFVVVPDLWVELHGDFARVKFTVELENVTSSIAAPTFVSIEEYNWVAEGEEKRDVGGGIIGIRRPLELAPGERVFMNRGDFTSLGASEFRKGRYAGAGMTGVVTLEDERGREFRLSFTHAEKFSMGDGGVAVSEPWADAPEGEIVGAEGDAGADRTGDADSQGDGFERLPEPAPL